MLQASRKRPKPEGRRRRLRRLSSRGRGAEGILPNKGKNPMTVNPYYELKKAAEGALMRLDELHLHTEMVSRYMSPDIDASLMECRAAAAHLREALQAIKE